MGKKLIISGKDGASTSGRAPDLLNGRLGLRIPRTAVFFLQLLISGAALR